MTNEKSPEQMAEEYASKNHYSFNKKGVRWLYARRAFLAGFQKCESTVAQPLREENDLAMFACKVAKEEIAALTAEKDALAQQVKALEKSVKVAIAELSQILERHFGYEEPCKVEEALMGIQHHFYGTFLRLSEMRGEPGPWNETPKEPTAEGKADEHS